MLLPKILKGKRKSNAHAHPVVPMLPERFISAYQAIQCLEGDERYLAAFIVGSVACGEASEQSTLDVLVIVNEKKPCGASTT